MIVKLRVKRTKAKDYKFLPKEFKDKKAWDTWYTKQIRDETHYKILDFEIVKPLNI